MTLRCDECGRFVRDDDLADVREHPPGYGIDHGACRRCRPDLFPTAAGEEVPDAAE